MPHEAARTRPFSPRPRPPTPRAHGDVDWGGLRIVGVLHRRVPWRPWRHTAADCRAAVSRCAFPPPSPLRIVTRPGWARVVAVRPPDRGVRPHLTSWLVQESVRRRHPRAA
ncbi:DUF2399 domain-containing protein [Streptomyces sp. NPDC059582]|uniref:DUF2399 domain-containing protein n=1 Tax=Streptomyces sp. NPDC059582 TaxID=3346875 RepID=UPI00367B0B63